MKKKFLRLTACLLLATLLILPLASCSSGTGKALLTLEKDGIKVSISVNVYQLLLTRMKGTLAFYGYTANGVNATNAAFWDYSDKFNGGELKTIDQYYCENILDNCRTFLVALYLFEKEGLKLTAAQEQSIEDDLDELIATDGGGSKTKLNSVLSAYGVNYNILKEVYTIEAKIATLQAHLYGEDASLLGPEIKTEYLEENYVHFRQVFIAAYHYVYETDKNGDVIYYHPDGDNKGKIFYDIYNGVTATDENGNLLRDEEGDIIYFVESTLNSDSPKIAYNSSGTPIYVLTDDGSEYKKTEMTVAELAEVKAKAERLLGELEESTYAEFEAALAESSDDTAEVSEFDDGYYLNKNVDYFENGKDYAYLDDIIEALDQMEDGDVCMIKSTFGYHIIKKYPHTEGAYDNEANEQWFSDFNSSLIEGLFAERCHAYFSDIVLSEKIYAEAPTMKSVSVNYYY